MYSTAECYIETVFLHHNGRPNISKNWVGEGFKMQWKYHLVYAALQSICTDHARKFLDKGPSYCRSPEITLAGSASKPNTGICIVKYFGEGRNLFP